MKYLLLIYSDPESWAHPIFLRNPEFPALPREQGAELTRRAESPHQEIVESGELVCGTALADPVNTRTIRVRDGLPTTTDGPYLDSSAHLAGFFVVDCDSRERAAEIAARFPDTRFAAVEVRPIMEMSGQEM